MILLFLVPAALFSLAMWGTLACLQPAEKSKDFSIGPVIAALLWFLFIVGTGMMWYLAENQNRFD